MSNPNPMQEYDEHPYTLYLDFGFSSFGNPSIDRSKGRIVLPVREFQVSPGFPGYDQHVIVLEGDVIFEKVAASIREISEIDQGGVSKLGKTQYKIPYKIDDGPFPELSEVPYTFYIGGFTYDPPGWVEWYIDVVTVKVRTYKTELPES